MGYPAIWSNILGVSVRMLLNVINVWIGRLETALPYVGGLHPTLGRSEQNKRLSRGEFAFSASSSWDFSFLLPSDPNSNWNYPLSSPGSPPCGPQIWNSQPPHPCASIPYYKSLSLSLSFWETEPVGTIPSEEPQLIQTCRLTVSPEHVCRLYQREGVPESSSEVCVW